MLTLGLSGNFSAEREDLVPKMHWGFFHDSAACLVRDGVLLAAVEEERLNRIKKTTKFPINAIRACLDIANCSAADIDGIGYYFAEKFSDDSLNAIYLQYPQAPPLYSRQLINGWFAKELGSEVQEGKLSYSPHHLAHGMSAFARAGMKEALVVAMDGNGEEECITIYRGSDGKLETLGTYPTYKSLGYLYLFGTMQLGYGFGDEYKVMGLAPYGRPEIYREIFESIYTLRADGDYEIHRRGPGLSPLAPVLLEHGITPRRKGEPLSQAHKDLAAGLQEALEKIVMHVLTHWQKATGLRAAAFSGGVAHNSSLNGLILRSGLFDEVFVHPASHDSGAAEGAALFVEQRMNGGILPRHRMRNASLGPDLGGIDEAERNIRLWGEFVDFERSSDIVSNAAQMLADGAVLGWAHGRSEFGPRALGNRSILADARPKENWTRINAMVKQRESYRPFAPVVTAEHVHTYFEIPKTVAAYDFMSFVVPVKPDRRNELGAVTHIDGTARLQVVDKTVNPRFHELVSKFGEITGTPVLLNTSFNGSAEPIVQDINDIMTCYLTSGLDYVIIEDFIVRRKAAQFSFDNLVIRFRPTTRLVRRGQHGEAGAGSIVHEIFLDYNNGPKMNLSAEMYRILSQVDGVTPVGGLDACLTDDLKAELYEIWQGRFVTMTPMQTTSR
jgi:predicted NodU family carbamoyl transferase